MLECVYKVGGEIFYCEQTHWIVMTMYIFYCEQTHWIVMTMYIFFYIISLVIQLSDLTLTVFRPRD